MSELIKKVVTSEHPIYTRRKKAWKRDERRYRGGEHVWPDLIPFQWEEDSLASIEDLAGAGEERLQEILETALRRVALTHYEQRQQQATYINFPKRMAEKFVGRLAMDAPDPGDGYHFGALGAVSKPGAVRDPNSRAEMLWTNADLRGTSLIAYFNEVQRWGMVTGHRWVGVAAPRHAPATIADEQSGRRPYLVHYSPLDVPNWDFASDGRLDFMVIRTKARRLVGPDGKYDGELRPARLLYVRKGFTRFGAQYAGAWHLFDDDGEPILDARDGQPGDGQSGDGQRAIQRSGRLDKTNGEIPYTVLFYEQDLDDMSRPGTSEIGSIGVSYMNISSAGDNDAIEAGGRTLYLLGVSQDAHNLATSLKRQGSRHIPVPAEADAPTPQIFDTGSVSASTAVEESLGRKVREAAIIAQDELQSAPDASGVAKQIEFMDVQVPRLALMALNREAAERQILRYACLMWGVEANADVVWKKKYDLDTTFEDWIEIFDASNRAGAVTPTLLKEGLRGMLKEKGITLDEAKLAAIDAEIDAAFEREAQGADVDRLFG